jgi:hypothetical protein
MTHELPIIDVLSLIAGTDLGTSADLCLLLIESPITPAERVGTFGIQLSWGKN